MPKTKSKKSQRRRQVHLFETPEFKAELKRSINENLDKMSQEGFTFPTNIPLEQLLAPCKKTRGKKGRITRPQNAFILYRKDLQEKIKSENPGVDFKEISKIAGNRWKNETDQIKNNYTLLATLGGLVHQDLFPNYKYQPRQKENSERKFKDEEEEEEVIVVEPSVPERTNKPWEAMPQLFNKSPKLKQELDFEENIPHIIQISPIQKNEPPDNNELNYLDDFQIDDDVINNLNNLNNQMSPLFNTYDHIHSSKTSSADDINVNDILIFPSLNYDIQPETNQGTTYVPVTTQVATTTIPPFYTSIMNNIPVYSDEIAPILTIASASTSPSFPVPNPFMDDPQTISDINNSYDMGFLDDWDSQELIERLDLYR